jgi:hypothetical protein
MADTKTSQSTSADAEWLDKATELKEAVLARLESMPEAQRATAPVTSEWSASGVVEHLILVEENLVGLWRQNLLEKPSPISGRKSGIVSGIVSFVFSKTGIRVPTVPELEPKEMMSIVELRKRWEETRERMVESLPDDTHSAWILHPAFGPLSSEQMGRLLASHLEYHLRHWPTPKA